MSENLNRLLNIMARLRDPDGGCPWDLEQTFETIAPYTIEEAYEVADAVQRGDIHGLKDELGDLLLQVVFHARMAEEAGHFDFDAVARGIADKMRRRHPHVFGDTDAATPDAVRLSWEDTKARERAEKGQDASALDGVAEALPALIRAEKLSKRAARVGFEWPYITMIFEDLDEEIGELRAELAATPGDPGERRDRLEDELGDILFCVANIARALDIDPEAALRRCNRKFSNRFRWIERSFAAEGRSIEDATLDDMNARWNRAKAALRGQETG